MLDIQEKYKSLTTINVNSYMLGYYSSVGNKVIYLCMYIYLALYTYPYTHQSCSCTPYVGLHSWYNDRQTIGLPPTTKWYRYENMLSLIKRPPNGGGCMWRHHFCCWDGHIQITQVRIVHNCTNFFITVLFSSNMSLLLSQKSYT